MNTVSLHTATNRKSISGSVVLVLVACVCISACSPNNGPDQNVPDQEELLAAATQTPAATVLDSGDASSDIRSIGDLDVSGAWIRSAPPGAMMLAGYFSLANHGSTARKLVGARSDAFGDVSIHRSIVKDGVSRMLPAGDLDVVPGQTLIFEPGGLHLMLMSPKSDVSAGQKIPLWLCFADGDDIEEIPVILTVGSAAPE